YGHVRAPVECASASGDKFVVLAGVEDGEAGRHRGDPVAVLSFTDGGVQDAVLGGREPVEGHQPLVGLGQRGAFLASTGDGLKVVSAAVDEHVAGFELA